MKHISMEKVYHPQPNLYSTMKHKIEQKKIEPSVYNSPKDYVQYM